MSNHFDLVLYHANCMDGIVAAWVAWRVYPDAEFIAVNYGEPPPDVHGRRVLIVDFSYDRATLCAMREIAAELVVLDHHKTAAEELKGLAFCVFDMNRSGAGITWDYLNEGQERPWIVDYVEDRDLWKFELYGSRRVNAYLATVRKAINEVENVYSGGRYWAASHGRSILRYTEQLISLAETYAKKATWWHDSGPATRVYLVNTLPFHVSEILDRLAEKSLSKVAVGWTVRVDGRVQCSVRSRGDYDASSLAKSYGGGGHPKAAGFTVDLERFLRIFT